MALRMSQMLRSSREVRRPGPTARRAPGAGPVEIDATDRVPEAQVEEPETVTAAAGEEVEPEEASTELESMGVDVGGEKPDAAASPAGRGELVYQNLATVAEQIFVAATEGEAPREAAIIGALRQVLERLHEDDELLAETVRQRQGSRTWSRRAANTAVLAMRLGMEVKYDERRCLALGLCALMHDLGMLKIPRELLDSQRLTTEQLELLRQHPTESQKMVTAFGPAFTWIGKIVVQVHERHDGSGYPHGLRGNQIHEMARILGMVDMYEAMAHPRADRPARVIYHALKEIIDLRNTLFERRLIKALIHIVSIFPLGSLVKLNNSEIGRVIGTSRTHPTRPTLEILVDSRGQLLDRPRRVDLQDEPMLYIVDPAIEEKVLEDTGNGHAG